MRIRSFASLVLSLLLGGRGYACGIDWQLPDNHFDGVNEFGFLSIWERVDELDLGGGLTFPIHANFSSSREGGSAFLGKGWLLALLESNIVQTGPSEFKLTQPEGRFRYFWRDKKQPEILNGQGGWKAKIQGSLVTVWANCGWKFSYTKGKISKIETPRSRVIDFVCKAGRVTRIEEKGEPKLVVEEDPATGAARSLSFNGKHIDISLGEKPNVQVLGGRSVIGGVALSLHDFASSANAPRTRFEFAVDDKLRPTLKITDKRDHQRLLTWDPATKLLLADGSWRYETVPHAGANASLVRIGPKQQSEAWYLDVGKGIESERRLDGTERVRSSFASGSGAGLLRSEVVTMRGQKVSEHRYLYDDKWKLIGLREIVGNGELAKTSVYNFAKPAAVSIQEGGEERIIRAEDLIKVALKPKTKPTQ
jgi:hypothetical protein